MKQPRGGLSLSAADDGLKSTIVVTGEVDIQTAPSLQACLRERIDQGITSIRVDLEHTGFMDSTGLGLLVGTARELQAAGGSLTLVNPSRPIMKIVDITGVAEIFAIE